MRSGSSTTTPWQKLLKFITNPMVEVIAAIVVVLVSSWIVIESETSRRGADSFPVLFGHK